MWTNKYIGIPYKANGRDISGADCWGLTRLVYSEQFNIELPSFSSEYDITDDERILELIAQYREGWEQQDAPVEGSLVLFRILGADIHIGIAISATHFLHIREGSDSAIESFDSVKWARRISGYFKYSPKDTGITLNAIPHPLRTERITKVVAPGTTLYEVYSSLNEEYNISPELKKRVNIIVNGRVIPEILWDTTILQTTDTIEYRAVPGKDATRMLATLVVMYVAYQVIGPWAFTEAGGTAATAASATAAATAASGPWYAYAAAAAASAGTMIAGGSLINALAPIRTPKEDGPPSSTAMLMVTGGSNSFTPYAAIPVVLGKVRMTPPLGASTYVSYGADSSTETVTSSDAYLNMLLAWGYGPLHIDLTTLRIGTTGITNYSNVNYATISYETTPTTAELTAFSSLYSQDVQQVYKGINLTFPGYTNQQIGVYTTADIDNLDYMENGSGSYIYVAPNYDIVGNPKYALVQDEITWTTQGFPLQYHPTTGAIIPIDKLSISIQYPEGLRTIYIKGDLAGQTRSADGTLTYQLRYNTGTTNSPIWSTWGQAVYTDPITGYSIACEGTFGAPNTNPVVDGFTTVTNIKLPRNNIAFEIRVRRIAENPGDYPTAAAEKIYHVYSATTLTAFTAYRNIDNVISDPLNSKIAKTAIHIKATDQLSGQIEGISAVVQTITPVWNGTAWVSGATSNPAALFRYILQHPGNPQRILDSEIDSKVNLTQLQHWSEYCVTKGFEFNTVLATQRSVSDVLRDVCAAGRASPAYVDGKWTVVIDEAKTNIIQHLSTHNSWGFEATKLLPKYPDALKIQFYDEENDYQQAETIVYVANKNASNAELFESIQLPGVTKASLVEDHARWHFAQIKLRPEIYTVNTDVEYLVCNRGDRVKVTHDVPMWGLGSGRIKNRITSSVFDIDEEVPVQASTRYTIRIRSATGTSTECELKKQFTAQTYSVISNIVTIVISNSTNKHPIKVGNIILISTSVANINTTATITAVSDTSISYILTHANVSSTVLTGNVNLTDGYYSTIQVLADVDLANATTEDLFLYGSYQTESQDLLVLSIEPMGGPAKSAKLTLVDYGVSTDLNIFTQYTTVTNATVFNSNMTNPPILLINSIGDVIPTITTAAIRSDESVMELISPGVFRYKLKVPYTNPIDIPNIIDSVEAQLCVITDVNSIGGVSETTLVNNGVITFTDVQLDYLYKVRLRYLGKDGRTGLWTSWVYPPGIVGKSNPPSNVAAFAASVTDGGIALTWTHCPEIDYASTIIKVGTTWSTAATMFEGAVDRWTYVRPTSNTYAFLIKHKDTSGNESTTATALSVSYTSLVLASITSELSNPTNLVSSDIDGGNPVLTLTGTTIKVYEGGTLLKYDAIGTANSRWKITTIVNSTGIVAAGIPATATAIDYATMPVLAGFTNTTSGTVTYTIDGKTSLGTAFTLTKVQYFTKVKPGATGTPGTNNAVVYAYKRSATVPLWVIAGTDKPSAVTYTFSSAGITTPATDDLTNGWTKAIPTGTDPLYVTVASASSNTTTDDIVVTEWATPVKLLQSGTDGLNTATVFLYARNSDAATTPTKVTTGTAVYTFSTGAIASQPTGWSRDIPTAANGTVIWVTQATASSTASTDNIVNTEWSAPVVLAQKGEPGIDSTAVGAKGDTAVFGYQVMTSAAMPTPPTIAQNQTLLTTTNTALALNATSTTQWYTTPKITLDTNEWQFQVSGTKTAAGVYTWQTQGYLSTFKVGKLDALSADLGAITAGSIKIGTSPVISSSAFTSGSGAVVNTNGSFGFGNTTTSIVGNGTGTITLTGNVVGSGNIVNNAITTAKLLTTGQGQALNDDPGCQDTTAWQDGSHGPIATQTTVTDGIFGTYVFRSSVVSGSSIQTSKTYPVSYLKKYKISAWVRRSVGGTGSFYLRPILADGTQLTGYIENIDVPTTWTKYSFEFIPTSAQTSIYLRCILNWTGTSGYTEVGDIRLEEKVTSDLVIDGAITATKISVSSLSAISADLGSITAGNLNINSGQASISSTGVASFKAISIFDKDGTAIITSGSTTASEILNTAAITAAGIDATNKAAAAQSAAISAAATDATNKSNSAVTTVQGQIGKSKWVVKRYSIATSSNTIPTYTLINTSTPVQTALVPDIANFDGNTIFGSNIDNYIGIASCFVYCSSAFSWTTTVGHDDGGSVYLNGVSIYSNGSYNRNTPAAITINFPIGWSSLELMWAEQGGGDGIQFGTALLSNSQIIEMWSLLNIGAVSPGQVYTTQTAANSAQTTANNAQTTASTAVTNAATAQTAANSAQTTANTGVANALTAQQTANAKLNKSASDTLVGPISLSAANAITVGTPALDSVAGHNGFYIGSTGIIGTKNGVATVSISNTGDAIFKGDLTGASGAFSGSLSAATGTFAGSLSAAGGTFNGALSAATGTFAGSLSAATGTFAGSLSAATGTFAGSLTVGTTPAVSGTTMTGSGAAINSNGSFSLGNSTTNITASTSGTITLNGNVVGTANIAINGVTKMSSTSPSDSGATTFATISVTTSGGDTIITGSGTASASFFTPSSFGIVYLYRDSTLIGSAEIGSNPRWDADVGSYCTASFSFTRKDTPAAGTYTYQLRQSSTNGFSNICLAILECKR